MSKPNTWWIYEDKINGVDIVDNSTGGTVHHVDPNFDCFCEKCCPRIHVIEKSAYDKLESKLAAAERALEMESNTPLDRSQEAAHYNWLEEEYTKINEALDFMNGEFAELKEESEKLASALETGYAGAAQWNALSSFRTKYPKEGG